MEYLPVELIWDVFDLIDNYKVFLKLDKEWIRPRPFIVGYRRKYSKRKVYELKKLPKNSIILEKVCYFLIEDNSKYEKENETHLLEHNYYNENIDINKLVNVHTLTLKGCSNIQDINKLVNVHTLYIRSCLNIQDINMLVNLKKLDLYGYNRYMNISSKLINV